MDISVGYPNEDGAHAADIRGLFHISYATVAPAGGKWLISWGVLGIWFLLTSVSRQDQYKNRAASG